MQHLPLPPTDLLLACLEYDPDTGGLLWKMRLREHFPTDRAWKHGNRMAWQKAGFVGHQGYIKVKLNGCQYKAHRVIWKMQTGDDPTEVDHINGDPSDNRWANLRLATRAQQKHNSRGWRGRELPKGVRQYGRRYVAQVIVNGQRYALGSFRTLEAARAAYEAAARPMHGEYYRP